MHGMASNSQSAIAGQRIADSLDRLPGLLPGYAASPPLSDRAFWSALPAKLAHDLVADAETALEAGWPALTASAYRAFTETGDRVGYETVYFARRRRLNALALGEAVEGKARFVDALIDGVLLVCEESGWQLPAHNSQERDGVFDPLPDPARPVIDLFAAETGAQLSLILNLFGDVFDARTPMIRQRIRREITTRITRPYLDRHFWWMGSGDEKMINWTPWCTQNVLISVFARSTSQATRRAVLAKAAKSLDAFMASYGKDGACDEGPHYYRHGALCLAGALDVMTAVAPDAFGAIWQDAKLRNMAEYIVNAHVSGAYYINFADASARLEPCSAREYVFGERVGSPALCALAAQDAKTAARPDLPDEVSLFNRLQTLTAACRVAAFEAVPVETPDIYYDSIGLFIARDGRFVLAAKAGDNDDGHNHNDVGSVTLYKNDRPLLIDLGVETYTKKTFSPERYDIWTMQSAWHNLPDFDGIGQMAGAAFAASDVAVMLGETASEIAMDIAGAYPDASGVRHYRRTVRLDKGAGVEIADSYEGDRPATLSLMFAERPAIEGERIAVGNLAEIAITGAGSIAAETIEITDPRLREAWPAQLYRVRIALSGPELRLWIT